MSKGREKHQARIAALNLFGKDLARRSGRKCELCETSGVPLSTFEVPPAPKEPEFDSCVFLCETCSHQIEQPKLRDADHWRCLANKMWSEVPIVQSLAIGLLAHFKEDWAQDAREMIFAEPEIMERAQQVTEETQ